MYPTRLPVKYLDKLPQRGGNVLMHFFMFSASILRHVYLRNGLGVGHLTRVYGGMKYNTDSNVCTVLKIKKNILL